MNNTKEVFDVDQIVYSKIILHKDAKPLVS